MEMTEYWKGHPVVLASGSPRRKELLEQIGIRARICPSSMEETSEADTPKGLVMELSDGKAREVASDCMPGTLVIGADTVVALDNEILGKPKTPERAAQMIKSLEGRDHQVYTGVDLMITPLKAFYHLRGPLRRLWFPKNFIVQRHHRIRTNHKGSRHTV